MIVLIIFLILLVLLMVGVSVPFSFGAATAVLQIIYDFNPVALLTTSFGKIQSVTLLAIPMFVLAGGVMEKGKIGGALIDFVDAFFGRIRGGLAIVTCVTSAIFGSICGSGAAAFLRGFHYRSPGKRKALSHTDHGGDCMLCFSLGTADPALWRADPHRVDDEHLGPLVLPLHGDPRYYAHDPPEHWILDPPAEGQRHHL